MHDLRIIVFMAYKLRVIVFKKKKMMHSILNPWPWHVDVVWLTHTAQYKDTVSFSTFEQLIHLTSHPMIAKWATVGSTGHLLTILLPVYSCCSTSYLVDKRVAQPHK